jgi:hypothetical protein
MKNKFTGCPGSQWNADLLGKVNAGEATFDFSIPWSGGKETEMTKDAF